MEVLAILARVVAIFVLGVLVLDELNVLVVVVAVLLLQGEPKFLGKLVDSLVVLHEVL